MDFRLHSHGLGSSCFNAKGPRVKLQEREIQCSWAHDFSPVEKPLFRGRSQRLCLTTLLSNGTLWQQVEAQRGAGFPEPYLVRVGSAGTAPPALSTEYMAALLLGITKTHVLSL